jgi:hypothetical protein
MTPTQMGNFALAHRLMNAPVLMIGAPIGAIINRSIARSYHDGQAVRRPILLVYGLAVLFGVLCFSQLAFLLHALETRLPPSWVDMAAYAPLVFLAGAFLFATSTIGFLPLLIHNLRFLVIWSASRILALTLGAFAVMALELTPQVFLVLFALVELCGSLAFVTANTLALRAQGRR